MQNIAEIENKHTSGVYAKQALTIVRGQGALLFDVDGVEYLDCSSGHGVANLGHAHPKIAEALYKQASTLITLFESFPNDQRAMLMEKMAALVPGLDRVFFCNSGTEAVEAAFKFSRISTGRKNIVAAMRAFHGRTYGSLSATYNKKYREGFEPLVPGFSHVAYNNIEALDKAVNEETAAVILEVVQGEGGVYPATAEYIQAARRICDERGALLIVDEIQTGFGRTGFMFAIDRFGVIPDILLLAKALGGGMPLGAFISSEEIMSSLMSDPVLGHITTFGGHPVCCAAGLASLNVIIEEQLVESCNLKSSLFKKELVHPLISEVRGEGLLLAVQLIDPEYIHYVIAHGPKYGLILDYFLFCNNALRIAPPLIISEEEISLACRQLKELLDDAMSNAKKK